MITALIKLLVDPILNITTFDVVNIDDVFILLKTSPQLQYVNVTLEVGIYDVYTQPSAIVFILISRNLWLEANTIAIELYIISFLILFYLYLTWPAWNC